MKETDANLLKLIGEAIAPLKENLEDDPYEKFSTALWDKLNAHADAHWAHTHLRLSGAPEHLLQAAEEHKNNTLAAAKAVWDAHPEHHHTDTFDHTVEDHLGGHAEGLRDTYNEIAQGRMSPYDI